MSIHRGTLRRLSPRSLAIPEIRSRDELDLLERIQRETVAFGDDGPSGWRLAFRRELDMTLDSGRFAARDALEARGLAPDSHGRWLGFRHAADRGDRDDPALLPLADGRLVQRTHVTEVWLPVWEGRMVDTFEPSAKVWREGRGRRALWSRPIGPPGIGPQFLVPAAELRRVDAAPAMPKVGFLAIGSATNSRTMIPAALVRAACGNSVPTLRSGRGAGATLALCAALGSLVYDHVLRTRLAGTNLNRFALEETPLPRPERLLCAPSLPVVVASLCWHLPVFAEGWLALRDATPALPFVPEESMASGDERTIRRAALEAVVARAFGLDADDLVRIAADAWRTTADLCDRHATRRFDPKGLWRIDRRLPPERRLPILAVAARRDLDRWPEDGGADAFLTGWRPPAELDLRALGFAGAAPGSRPVGLAASASHTVDRHAAWRRCATEAARAAAFDE